MITYLGIDFNDICKHYDEFLDFAVIHSELFSVITCLKKPYSKIPPNCGHDSILEPLKPYLERQIVAIRKWSNNNASNNHTVMNVYFSNKSSFKAVKACGNFLLPETNNLPEDFCLYKGNTIWFSSVSHEKLMFLYSNSKEDISFLEKNNIQYYLEGPHSIYRL